jgi:hypothetical protein
MVDEKILKTKDDLLIYYDMLSSKEDKKILVFDIHLQLVKDVQSKFSMRK